jgi:hypothetical protein
MLVWKAGSATGVTHGSVVEVNHSGRVVAGGVRCMAEGLFLVRALGREPFALAGDSGAVVADGLNRAVGLLWGTRVNGDAVVTPIEPVLFAMNITLEDES